jgi:tagatose-6-phosphate ketose/aldose isomerase
MTSSFSTMLLTCLMLSKIDTIENEKEAIEATAANAQAILEQYIADIEKIAARPFERGVFLGSGPMKGIAEECHLKLQELTDGGVVCKFDTFLGFRHGPKAVVNEKSIVVYLMQDKEDIQRYERDLVKQVSGNNKLVAQVIVTTGARVNIEGVEEDLQVVMPNGSDKTSVYGILPYVVVGQLLGFHTSIAHGLCPDTPSVSGNIHRVVEGVIIYE